MNLYAHVCHIRYVTISRLESGLKNTDHIFGDKQLGSTPQTRANKKTNRNLGSLNRFRPLDWALDVLSQEIKMSAQFYNL